MLENWEEKYGMVRRLLYKAEEPIRKGIKLVQSNGYQLRYPWACPEISNKKYKVVLTSDYPDATRVIARLYLVGSNELMAEKTLNGLYEGFEQAVQWLKKYKYW